MNELNIVLTTDDNYIVPTMVTISSILSSANADTKFHVYILCAKALSQDGRQRITSVRDQYGQVVVTFLEIDDAKLSLAVTTAYIPIASYYRLYISSLISAERCLFIDGDMIVRQDLTEVYNTDLEGYYAAGVKDMGVQCHFTEYEDYAEYLGIPNMNTYVNAGFMIFNLKKIREDGIDCRMIEAIDKGYKYMDQDIINRFCYGKIKILPLKYDFFTEYFGILSKQNLSGYTPEEVSEIDQGIAVYHFVGIFKPWVCTRLTINQIWWDEAKKILDAKLYERVLEQAEEFERKSDWEYIIQAVGDKKQIVVFGCSKIGLTVAGRIKDEKEMRTIVFADNDAGKIGTTVAGIHVLSAKEAFLKYPDALYIISSQNGFKQIGSQLLQLGVNKKNILRYVHKDETYYSKLDERFAAHEKQQIEMCGQQ